MTIIMIMRSGGSHPSLSAHPPRAAQTRKMVSRLRCGRPRARGETSQWRRGGGPLHVCNGGRDRLHDQLPLARLLQGALCLHPFASRRCPTSFHFSARARLNQNHQRPWYNIPRPYFLRMAWIQRRRSTLRSTSSAPPQGAAAAGWTS